MTRSSQRWTLLVVALLTASAVGWAAGRFQRAGVQKTERAKIAPEAAPVPSPASSAIQTSPPTDYVGSEVCANCHGAIAARYRTHPMAHSFGPVEPGTVPDSASSGNFKSAAHEFDIAVRDGVMWHGVQRKSAEGETLYRFEDPVHFAIGSGQRGKSFVTRKGTRLFQSPVTWYTGGGWDLSPGYEHDTRVPTFERKIGAACLNCHVGRIDSLAGKPDEFGEQVCLEAAIGCERCHGPGQRHVAAHNSVGGLHVGTPDPIVNPADLPRGARDAVCYQCHLTGAERVVRSGRRESDFRPGADYESIWIAFLHDTRGKGDSADAVSQVEQMEESRCFQGTAGQPGDRALSCISCHDPHEVPGAAQRLTYYREKCLVCHGKAGCSESVEVRLSRSPSDSCIECHMPRGAASDVPHTSQTNHQILRRPKASPAGKPSPELRLFRPASERLPQAEVDRATGLLMSQYARRYNDRILGARGARLLGDLEGQFPDDPQLHLQLGLLEEMLRSPDDAERSLKTALRLAPDEFEIRKEVLIWMHKQGRYDECVTRMREMFEIAPDDTEIAGRLIHSLGMVGRTEDGVDLAEQHLRRFPYDWQVTNWLARAYERLGKQARSWELKRRVDILKPSTATGL